MILPALTPQPIVKPDGTATLEARTNDEDIKKAIAALEELTATLKSRIDTAGIP